MLSPLEFYNALQDHEAVYFGWVKLICSTLRLVALVVYNSAFGRKRKDKIEDPQRLIKFSWENKPKIRTTEEIKEIVMGLAHMQGVTLTQQGKEVKFEDIK